MTPGHRFRSLLPRPFAVASWPTWRHVASLCSCFASAVAPWPTWRRAASLCTCSCGTVASWPTWRRVASFCSCFASSVASCPTWRHVASFCCYDRVASLCCYDCGHCDGQIFFLALACRGTLLRVSEVCGNVRKVWWRSLHSGQSQHDGGERFFTLGLTRNGSGLCNYCKVNVCAITIRFPVIVTLRTPHCLRIVLSPLALLIVRRL